MPKLSDSQISSYERDGYLVVTEPVFSDQAFAGLISFAEEQFERAEPKANGRAPQLIDCPHWSDPKMFEWLFADEMVDLVEPLIGPDIALFASHFLLKPPGAGKRVPWHEDSAYWKGRLEPMQVASVNLALSPSWQDSGCMRVIPGTHRLSDSEYKEVAHPCENVFMIEIPDGQFDESEAMDLLLEPNQAHLHHASIIHGSNPNGSAAARFCLAVRYFPADVKFVDEKNPDFQIYLVRGKDRAGNRYSDPRKAYPPAGTI
ncbi:MAG: phytanoyl-CoA dioxygenase family protein [Planctomycetota bacterium]|jgi:ectoine hydroxylase-related dioxygenase (phytanoyl-CoA dioxygenase family)|nr:phytanoyl-CoA dioxygenase family protein [Planctomycetota bacterium]